ncbi:MAG: glycine betaine ABC transporter substrate-binding protein [Gemmatimonadota bacterium]
MKKNNAMTALVCVLVCVSNGGVAAQVPRGAPTPIVIASKPFGESYLLCEMFAQLLEARGIEVERRPGLGATEIAVSALRTGAIDVYPEYTGTGLVAVLHDTLTDSLAADPRRVFARVSTEFPRRFGLHWAPPLGFQNTYAIAVTRPTADRYHLRTLSDLARAAPQLTAGFTADFIGRPDGLVGLRRVYGLALKAVRPLAPAVKYQALATGAVDVVDGYSTDGLLAKYDLVVLADDRHFFPPYEAAALVSRRVGAARPDVMGTLAELSGRLDEDTMRRLNRRVEVDGVAVAVVAAGALRDLRLIGGVTAPSLASENPSDSFPGYLIAQRSQILSLALRHLVLVLVALFAAIAIGVPIGLALERSRALAEPVIRVLGMIQTIPSIALLAFMIPFLGVGVVPAIVALWLYALLPIVRGTFNGVRDADPDAVEAAEALGMTALQRLMQVRLPLAAPVIMAGIRTAAVITVGTATLAAFIGAGGLGEPIVAGLSLADSRMVLSGALPAALLALLVDGGLAVAERVVAPAHLRSSARL